MCKTFNVGQDDLRNDNDTHAQIKEPIRLFCYTLWELILSHIQTTSTLKRNQSHSTCSSINNCIYTKVVGMIGKLYDDNQKTFMNHSARRGNKNFLKENNSLIVMLI